MVPAVAGPSKQSTLMAKYANIINQVDEILAFFALKVKPPGILLPSKHSRRVKFDTSTIPALTISDNSSAAASIGSFIEPTLSYDNDSISPFDLPTSA
jgi:hypothetical protein